MNKLILVFCVFASGVQAQTQRFPEVAPYRMAAADAAPVLDGEVDDAVWSQSPLVEDFHQIRPTDRGEASERTEVRMVYDKDHLYVGVKLFDSQPEAISAKGLIQGQTFFSDDRFEFRLDTFNDRRNSYFFQVNPNGVRREALAGNDYWIEEWDTIWFAQAKLQPWGWSAEIKVPFKSISFDPDSDTWGLNFSRVIPRKGEETPWSSQERRINPSVSGYAVGMQGMRQGRGLEFVPSVTARLSEDESGNQDTEFDPSLTTFYRFTPFLTGALTLNTDFAATEVDDRQVNLSRFSLFFPEKRDFFLQDASIFEFGGIGANGRPFFSRKIGLSGSGEPLDINAGIKLTGRAGDWNVGALAVNQDVDVAGASENLFVGRVSRNVSEESSFGMIATYGDPASATGNNVLGVDYNYQNSNAFGGLNVRGNVWAQQSDTPGLAGEERAYGARFSLPNDRVSGQLTLNRIEENFRPALGFVNRSGVDIVDTNWRYRHRLQDHHFQWIGSRVQFFRADRLDGGLQSQRAYLNFAEGFTSQNDFFTFFTGEERENLLEPFEIFTDIVIPAGNYSFKRHGMYLEFGQQRPLSGAIEVVDGDFFGGTNLVIAPTFNWRPNRHVRLGATYISNDVELPQGDFQSRLYRTRADIAFNAQWSWLNFVQGDNFSDEVGINSRLRWQPRPDREFFLVFNQRRARDGWESLETEIAVKATINFRL